MVVGASHRPAQAQRLPFTQPYSAFHSQASGVGHQTQLLCGPGVPPRATRALTPSVQKDKGHASEKPRLPQFLGLLPLLPAGWSSQ